MDFATQEKLTLRNENLVLFMRLKNNANPYCNPKITQEKGQQILSVESFIQISTSLVSKAKRVKLSHRGSTRANFIW